MSGDGVGGSRTVDDGSLQHRVGLAADDTTVAELLSDRGYATGAAGKWGLGEPGTDAMPTRKGFDRWFGYLNQRRAHTYWPPHLWTDETRVDYPRNSRGPSGPEAGPYAHDLIEEFAVEFVQEHADERFFAFFPFTLPHSELAVPEHEPFVEAGWSDDERAVFVTVDHGGDSHPEEPFSSTDPLRGYKRDLSEGGIRVPMIARWPGTIPAGEVREDPWYFPDVYDDWKAYREDRGGEVELYDLSADVAEEEDVSDAHPGIVGRFERFFADAHEESPHWPTW